MGLSSRLVARAAVCLPLATTMPMNAIAGGASFDEDEQQNNLPSYFGFARDTHGTFLSGVKVTLKFPHASIVARTDPLGAYKIPVSHTEPGDVDLSCDQDGYRQTGLVRRTPPGVDEKTSVEIDCTLERQ
jgi:hypothetical protein